MNQVPLKTCDTSHGLGSGEILVVSYWAVVTIQQLATRLHRIASKMMKCMSYLHNHLTPTTLTYLKAQ
jgi:hypothetical protein